MTTFEKSLNCLIMDMKWESPKYKYPQSVEIKGMEVTVEFNDGTILINTANKGTFEASLFVKRKFYRDILEPSGDFDELELETIRYDNCL